MKYLITGGCGFIGSNLSAEVIKRGEKLIVFDNLFRKGSSVNLKYLEKKGSFTYYPFDIRNQNEVEDVIKNETPDVIFHLAGQVAMTKSILDPRLDFEINAIGTFNLLESVRKFSPESKIIYSSSNKVYGDLKNLTFYENETRFNCKEYPNGFNEDLNLDFHSPYGCSKGTADQYLLDYNRIYNIKTTIFRHSSMYGGNQHATIDQGWVTWFCQKALDIKNKKDKVNFTISGSGKQVRDLLHVEDVINLYFLASQNIELIEGRAFNIGGGVKNSLSLIELFGILEEELKIEMRYIKNPPRESDQLVFIADNTRISKKTGWKPLINKKEGIIKTINWLEKQT